MSGPTEGSGVTPRPPDSERLIHEPADGDRTVLATHVETADTFLARARGLTFRRRFPEGHALVFPFGRAAPRTLHMVCVPFPIDAVWLVDDRVERVATLSPWSGLGRARADAIVELPAGTADDVDAGDRLFLDRRE